MKLYDAYGREVATEALREEQAAPTMAGVRNIYSAMHPSAGLTPERLIAIQREAEMGDPYLYLELAEEMEEKDLHYLAVIGTRKQAVAGAELIVTPASEAATDRRAADLVREVIGGGALDLESALYDILDAVGKGFSATEIVWDTGGREWVPRRLIWRDPRFFMFDWISGNELLVRTLRDKGPLAPADATRAAPARPAAARHYRSRWYAGAGEDAARLGIQPLTAPLAPFKFIVHVARAKSGLPVRGGIARAAGWAYLFKNYVLKDWVTFAEIFGQPLRLGKYGPGATEADKQALLSAVANIGTDAAAIVPESMLIEFVEARQAGGAELYERFCEYLDRQVSKAVLGQTLTTETPREGGGSRAAAQVHDAVRRDIIESDARRLGATLTRDLARPIVDLNLGPQQRYPQIALGLSSDSDVKLFADMVAELADRGLRIGQRAVLKRLGLPEPATDEPLLEPAGGRTISGLGQRARGIAAGVVQRQRRGAVVAQHQRRARLARAVEQREPGRAGLGDVKPDARALFVIQSERRLAADRDVEGAAQMLRAVEQGETGASLAGHAERGLRNSGARVKARARRALHVDADRGALGPPRGSVKLEQRLAAFHRQFRALHAHAIDQYELLGLDRADVARRGLRQRRRPQRRRHPRLDQQRAHGAARDSHEEVAPTLSVLHCRAPFRRRKFLWSR